MLVKVNGSKGATYINIDLDDVAQLVVSQRESSLTLKDGKHYLTNQEEAQRIVGVMRKRDDENAR